MLVREQPATDLAIATRILARAHALTAEGRVTLRLHDVLYIGGRAVSLAAMTPYDVAVVLAADGSVLHGTPPDDVDAYLAAHRRWPDAGSVARLPDGTYVSAPSLRACAVAALGRARGEAATADAGTIERAWLDLVSQARISGALIGAFPTEDET
ncbi:MAG: class II aldolase/adducin family protein [Chloroflexota bacterium]